MVIRAWPHAWPAIGRRHGADCCGSETGVHQTPGNSDGACQEPWSRRALQLEANGMRSRTPRDRSWSGDWRLGNAWTRVGFLNCPVAESASSLVEVASRATSASVSVTLPKSDFFDCFWPILRADQWRTPASTEGGDHCDLRPAVD